MGPRTTVDLTDDTPEYPSGQPIFTIPVRAAVQFNVPLIVWGENSQNEYGGSVHR